MNKNSLKGYFSYTLKERRGTIAIIALVLICLFSAQYIYPLLLNNRKTPPGLASGVADSLRNKTKDADYDYPEDKSENNYRHTYERYNKPFTGAKFYFDPNTLNTAGWQMLGVRERTIAGIQKYIAKGGRFRDAESLRKVWGLSDEEKDRLVPYVRIAQEEERNNYPDYYEPYHKKEYEKAPVQPVDINTGDSAAFVSLPGIGPGFAARILRFRNKLGGFYKADQVGETYGLPDSVFQKIKPLLVISGDNIHKININTATNDELKAHPYIRWQLANVITEYKKQHGNFTSLEELKKIMIIDEETYKKISPYLSL
jgi:DNA uptake protein ComE-like DNA-binding protein